MIWYSANVRELYEAGQLTCLRCDSPLELASTPHPSDEDEDLPAEPAD